MVSSPYDENIMDRSCITEYVQNEQVIDETFFSISQNRQLLFLGYNDEKRKAGIPSIRRQDRWKKRVKEGQGQHS